MADIELVPFTKTYKYTKKEDAAFLTKYLLCPNSFFMQRTEKQKEPKTVTQEHKVQIQKAVELKAIQTPKKEQKMKEEVEQNDEDYQDVDSSDFSTSSFQSQEQEVHFKESFKDFKKDRRQLQMTLQQLNQYQKYQKVNLKNIKIVNQGQGRKKQHKMGHQKKQFNRQGFGAGKYDHGERNNTKFDKTQFKKQKYQQHQHEYQGRKPKKNREQRNRDPKKAKILFEEYLSLEVIQKSRADGQNKYYSGRVEFGQGPKWRGKIVSEEFEGNLIIQGQHRNRTLHNDRVYFITIKQQKQKIRCKIVHVVKENRPIIGKLELIASRAQYILTPINSRISSLNVIGDSVTNQMKKDMGTHYFRVELVGWDIKSEFPECRLVEVFGKFGEIQIETCALLRTNGVEDVEHDDEKVRKDLDPFISRMNEKGQYQIPEQQIAKRQDLRKKRIFTIDPLHARDFDDALSITKEGDGYQLGVHIADPSYFVREGSYVDDQARKRTTSVYLVHRVIPMLPRLLCQNFCSLNPGCERLTFSLWVKLDKNGDAMQEPRVTRSVIKSCARFTYEQAQSIIEGQIKSQKDVEQGFGCVNSQEFDAVAEDVKIMHFLSKKLRNKRIKRGSLFFDVPRKTFVLDEAKNPLSFNIYERKEAHFLVEEFMILANEKIGQILVKDTKENALLRRHKYPGPKKIIKFEAFMKKIGLPIKFTEDTHIQDVIDEVLSQKDISDSIKNLVKYEMIGLLEAADYFVVAKTAPKTWVHYALNSPIYTHFTSPIRRYPDILVHRQLAAIIEKRIQNSKIPNKLISQCNERKLMAKRVSNGCEKIFMCLYLKSHKANAMGIISEAEDWGIKIVIPSFDFRGTMRIKQIQKLSLTSVEEDVQGRKQLKLTYKGKEQISFLLKQYQEIQLNLACKDGFPMDYHLSMVIPHPRKQGQNIIIG